MADIYFRSFYQYSPQACISDLTPPTFTGITSAIAQGNGSIKVNFPQATDATNPIRYRIFIAAGSVLPAALFVSSNIVQTIEPSGSGPYSAYVYTLADQTTYLAINGTYTFGVRAVDAVGNQDSNVLTDTEISNGVLPDCLTAAASSLAATELLLQTDHTNFQSDHTNFQSDHTNFQSDHTSFQGDHSNFQTDHSNLQTDHTNFQSDHTSFQSDHTNFGTDHTNFVTDHSNFQTDHSNFVTDLSTLNTYLSTFNTYLATMNSENADFANNNTDLADNITDLAAQLAIALGLVNALQVLATSQNANGTSFDVSQSEFSMDISLDEENI